MARTQPNPEAAKALREHLKRGERRDFAHRIGVAPSYLDKLISGHVAFTPELAVAIERETEGGVPRRVLRPDIFQAAG